VVASEWVLETELETASDSERVKASVPGRVWARVLAKDSVMA
jgi:hypothetical protein